MPSVFEGGLAGDTALDCGLHEQALHSDRLATLGAIPVPADVEAVQGSFDPLQFLHVPAFLRFAHLGRLLSHCCVLVVGNLGRVDRRPARRVGSMHIRAQFGPSKLQRMAQGRQMGLGRKVHGELRNVGAISASRCGRVLRCIKPTSALRVRRMTMTPA
jgi:hypothetical protein